MYYFPPTVFFCFPISCSPVFRLSLFSLQTCLTLPALFPVFFPAYQFLPLFPLLILHLSFPPLPTCTAPALVGLSNFVHASPVHLCLFFYSRRLCCPLTAFAVASFCCLQFHCSHFLFSLLFTPLDSDFLILLIKMCLFCLPHLVASDTTT